MSFQQSFGRVFCVGRRAFFFFFLICPLPFIYKEIFGFEDSFSDEEISV